MDTLSFSSADLDLCSASFLPLGSLDPSQLAELSAELDEDGQVEVLAGEQRLTGDVVQSIQPSKSHIAHLQPEAFNRTPLNRVVQSSILDAQSAKHGTRAVLGAIRREPAQSSLSHNNNVSQKVAAGTRLPNDRYNDLSGRGGGENKCNPSCYTATSIPNSMVLHSHYNQF